MIAADVSLMVQAAQPIAIAATGAGAYVFSSESTTKIGRTGFAVVACVLFVIAAVMTFDYVPPCDQLPAWLWYASGCFLF